jgi:DNA-binding transcriptional ArsR family regulator
VDDTPDIAAFAAVVAEPARARMLGALMDGRALTATELALEGGVAPSTASSHLARLAGAGLVALARQGRHRYFRLAGPEVAELLERLMAATGKPRARTTGPRDEDLRHARVCYDHLAGETGVRLFERLCARKLLRGSDDALGITRAGEQWAAAIGIDLGTLRAVRRPLCRPCLDWSERRMHLAGGLGAAILDRLLALRYARRQSSGRALAFSPLGESFLEHLEVARRR